MHVINKIDVQDSNKDLQVTFKPVESDPLLEHSGNFFCLVIKRHFFSLLSHFRLGMECIVWMSAVGHLTKTKHPWDCCRINDF